MRAIFVSYRRDDAEGEAGRLFDDLVKHFGASSVFIDVATIDVGRDFRKAIDESIADCGVLLAVIGKSWIDARDEHGQRRLDDASDFVRLETASALKRDIPVIPILVHGARMPRPEQLPDDLKELAYRNGVELTHARWSSDFQLLAKGLRRTLGDRSSSKPQPNWRAVLIGSLCVVVIAAIGLGVWRLMKHKTVAEQVPAMGAASASPPPDTAKKATGDSSASPTDTAAKPSNAAISPPAQQSSSLTQQPAKTSMAGAQSKPTIGATSPTVKGISHSPKKIAVSAGVMAGNKLGGMTPEYPAIAKAARIQGTVVIAATISTAGTVEALHVLSGPPMLQQAAIDGVKTWRYRPYLLNGEPVAVETQINVIFTLGGSALTSAQ
jgi:TonB family protein